MPPDEVASRLRVGSTRIQDGDGFVGTVVYVGPVPSARDPEEIYAGVAWDDASRGKHDGSVICRRTNRLVRLFSCDGGSFMRLRKLDLGTTLDRDLMRTKYVTAEAPLIAPDNFFPHSARTAGGREKPIEFVGEVQIRKQQQLENLDKISLRNLGIASVVADGSLADFSGLREIDLAGNLLSDWGHVGTIFGQFPLLEVLSLASNRLCDMTQGLELRCYVENVKILNLNGCSISWAALPWIAQHIPNIQDLCIAYNDMSCIPNDFSVCGLDRLQFLDLSGCLIDCWEKQVVWLAALPQLQQLVLDDNPIERIPRDASMGKFRRLSYLYLSGTKISSWTHLDSLALFPSLVGLHLRRTPLTDNLGAAEARALAIARLPNIKTLNSSPVTTRERTEAERQYIGLVARELLIASSTEDENCKDTAIEYHPRFDELVAIHQDAMVRTSHGSFAHRTVNITIRSMASASCSSPPLHKRLPGSLLVGRIKALCFRAFGLDPDLQILHFHVEDDPFPKALDDDKHTLSYFGVGDGAEILMKEVDLNEREKEEARVVAEHSHRVAVQERVARDLQELRRAEADCTRSAAIDHAV